MTPSSLAPSMLKGGNTNPAPFPAQRAERSQSSKPPSVKDSRRKGGLFGLFRSRSSPPKQDARVTEALGGEPAVKPRQRSTSQTTITAVAASVRNIIAPHPNPGRSNVAGGSSSAVGQKSSAGPSRSTTAPPPGYLLGAPIADSSDARTMGPQLTAPTPVRVPSGEVNMSGRRSPSSKMFTPFRLISKRHRTVSAASNEAADGTAVSNTRSTWLAPWLRIIRSR